MSLLSSLLRIWKGDVLHEEKEKSQQALAEAREAIRETRAMLDGEEGWLIVEKKQPLTGCKYD